MQNDDIVISLDFQGIGTEDYVDTQTFVRAFAKQFLTAAAGTEQVERKGIWQPLADFLAQLRAYYLNRENQPIFQSVVLAVVYDVKNLKLKIRPDVEHQYNSPWNIAADFTIDMNFSVEQIAAMLGEYEADQHTGMDVKNVSEAVFAY
ncbi:MAG: hypothetical protein NC416_14710 [Eubacterium sp.]|nr:hypothetical protein [Eubacterium sp.]